MTDIIKNTGQKVAELTAKIAGTPKRHESILTGIVTARTVAFNNVFMHKQLSNYLKTKLNPNKDEGIILSYMFYRNIFRKFPKEEDIADLQYNLEKNDLNIIPIYKVMEEGELPTALFMVIHTKLHKAIAFADDLKEIISGQKASPKSAMVMAALKVTEALANHKIVDIMLLAQSLTLLTGDEVYCVSIDYFKKHRIDPKALDENLERLGFKICKLLNMEERVETIEQYKYYDGLEGLLISRTNEGIRLAQEHYETMKLVCNTAEAGVAEAALTMK